MSFDWQKASSALLRSEITKADITLAQLVVRLKALGINETEAALKQKIYRGSFSMPLFLQCMQALGHNLVSLDGVLSAGEPSGKDLDE
jgi:hypothetical protein